MKRVLILTAIVITFLTSCKNATTGLPVPKDALMVVHLNASSLTSKLSWKDIQASDWFKEAYRNEDDSFHKKILDNPENSGVDVKSDFVFFLKKQSRGGYIVFEGKLKDAKAFEELIKKEHHNPEIKKDGDLSYVKDEGTDLLIWTNSKFFIMSDVPLNRPTNITSWDEYDKSRFHQDSLMVFAKQLLNLSSSNSIEDDKRFASLLKENGDVHFWMNVGEYMSAVSDVMSHNPMMSMMQGLNSLFEGTISTGTLSFDDGKISVHTKRYLNDKMKQAMEKYPYKNITEDEVNRIPSNDVDAALIVNYPPEASKELFKTLGVDGFINGFLGKYNTNLDEIVQAMKGNVILSVSDFGFTNTQRTIPGSDEMYSMPQPNVKVLFAMSINNKPTFDKLFGLLQQQIPDSEITSKIHYKTANDWFAVSNQQEAVDQFLSGNNNKLAFADKIVGHPFGAYVDLHKILKGTQSSPVFKVDTAAINMWQDIVAVGGDYKDGVLTGEFTINLVDKSTNSLKQINQFVDRMYHSAKSREQEYMRNYPSDSTVFEPPIIHDTTSETH